MNTRVSVVSVFLALVLIGGAGTVAMAGDVTSKVDVSLWGRAKFDMHYDTADIGGFTDFATYVSSDPDAEGNEYDGELNFNGRDTRFGFKGSMVDGDITCGAVGEIDFYGTNAGNNLIPRMRLGYVFMEKNNMCLRMGQDWIPIGQQNPATIDFGILSYGGNLWWRVPQITARFKTEAGVEILGSVMKHRVKDATDTDELLPWIMGRVAYSGFMDGKGMVAAGGGFRSVSFEEADPSDTTGATMEDVNYMPYVAIGEVVLPFTEQVTLKGEFYYGAGVGEEFLHYGFEYNTADPDEDWDAGTVIPTMGGFVSLTFKANDKMSINVGGGMDDPDEEDADGLALRYTKNTVIFGNLKHSVTKNMGFGVEVMHFITEQGEDAQGDVVEWTGQRITGSTWFTF